MQWFDLSDERGARLRFAVNKGKTYLLIFGLDSARSEWQQAIRQLGYRAGGSGKYLLREASGKLSIRDYRQIFPNARVAEMAREDVEVKSLSRQAPASAPAATPAATAPAATAPAGSRPRPSADPGRVGHPVQPAQVPAAAAPAPAAEPASTPASAPTPAPASPFARLSAMAREQAARDAAAREQLHARREQTAQDAQAPDHAGSPAEPAEPGGPVERANAHPVEGAVSHGPTSESEPASQASADSSRENLRENQQRQHREPREPREARLRASAGARRPAASRPDGASDDVGAGSAEDDGEFGGEDGEDSGDVSPVSSADSDTRALSTEDGASRYWGRNQNGDKVFEGAFGRYIEREKDGVQVTEAELPVPVYFLRASSDGDAMACADGFVQAMLAGEVQYQEDLERLAEAMTGTRVEGEVARARAAVEAAMTRYLRREFEVPHDAYDTAVHLYERLPEALVRNRGHAALPLPLAVAAQWLVGDTRDKRVAVPHGQDGALAAVLPKGSEIRAGRNEALPGAASPADLSEDVKWYGAVYALDAQALLFNADPVYGAVRTIGGSSGVTLQRADYVEAVEQVLRLDDGGRAVLVLAGDDSLSPGVIADGDSRTFYDWLAARTTIDAAFETGVELQRRAGTASGLRLVAIKKVQQPVTAAVESDSTVNAHESGQRIRRFKVLHDWDDVRDAVRDAIRERGIEEALPEGINLDRETAENVLQVPYQAASQLGEARTMVPKNMFGALNEKFAEIASLYGSPEQIVGRGLHLSPAELAERFSPEQLDAIALGIVRNEKESRSLIVCDETGIGKGRTIGGLCSWALQQGHPVIFLTKGTNLFSDLVRDMKDIKVWDSVKPFLVNAESALIDIMGDRSVLAKGTSVDQMRKIADTGMSLGELDCNMVFATYSQFSGKQSAKAKWLLSQCKDAFVVVDEAHEAAGASSNIANFVETLTSRAWGVVYSSATWAKSVENIGIYRRALPPQINVDGLRQTMQRGGEGFLETLSTMLAREGALIRREHDMSRLVVQIKIDEGRRAQNEAVSDQIAEVLGAMAFVAGETNRMFTKLNSETLGVFDRARTQRTEIVEMIQGQLRTRALNADESADDQAEARRALRRMRVARLQFNLGTNLYQTIRRVEAAMTAEYTADLVIEALQEGRKPVIVFEDTNEKLTQRVAHEATVRMHAAARREGIPEDQVPKVSEIETPNVKHMLRHLAASLGVVSWRSGEDMLADIERAEADGNRAMATDATARAGVHGEDDGDDDDGAADDSRLQFIDDIEGLDPAFREKYRAGMQRIMESIDALPDLAMSVPDILTARLTHGGYRVGEVSGRVTVAHDIGGGRSVLGGRNNSKKKVTASVNAFNDGDLDVTLINRAGAAGISLHASPRFADTRQRELFETQIPNNVSDRIQLFGRVNRYDQVTPPIITCVSSGLYASLRLLMMQNGKLRRLSANMRSSRNNVFEDNRIPDLVNGVGRDAAIEFLRDNPGMLLRLGLDESIMSSDVTPPITFADTVIKRVPLLRVAEQKRVYEELLGRFDDIVLRAEMRGENPLNAQEIPHKVRQVERTVLSGIEIPGQSVFDSPVYVSEIQWEEEVQPARWGAVTDLVKGGRGRLVEQGVGDFDNRYAQPVSAGGLDVSRYVNRVGQMFEAMSRIALQATNYQTVEAALAARNLNAVERCVARGTWFRENVPNLTPGALVNWSVFGDEGEAYVVTGWTMPAHNRELNLDQHKVQMIKAGDRSPFEMSLAAMMSYGDDVRVLSPDVFDPQGAEVRLVEAAEGVDEVVRPLSMVRSVLAESFEESPGGRLIRTRTVLDGNLYAASEIAAENKLGSGVLFTDEKGVRRRAIMVKANLQGFDLRSLPRAISRHELLVRIGRDFSQFGQTTTIPFHLSLHDAIKRNGEDVLYFAMRDGSFIWQLQTSTPEARRLREKLRMAGDDEVLGNRIGSKRNGRGRTAIFSGDITTLPIVLRAKDVETVYLTRRDYDPLHAVLDVYEDEYRAEQIVVRDAMLRERQVELARMADEDARAAAEAHAAVAAVAADAAGAVTTGPDDDERDGDELNQREAA
ncbi:MULTISPECIES: strawberry notch C-terminal domain-containing protein [unclassified Burkholderia]|uniref:strawberry notch C-terminal domain-containing protein n=1 Tax=unclassified Burkholderia TaxID=2613784 RepID=UPI002AAF0EB4|nr:MULTISPECIES: strawberry notch C-terminal domain-containing protein [unclassified Burkholderia]